MHASQMEKSNLAGGSNGIIISDDANDNWRIANFLAEHCNVRVCSQPNLNRVAGHLDGFRFVVLGGRDRKRVLETLAWIRLRSKVAVIVVGNPGSEEECVMILEHGADDYVLQQTCLRELLARIRTVLRYGRPHSSSEYCRYLFGGWEYDHGLPRLTNPQRLQVALTNGERILLKAFLDSPHRMLSREHLAQAVRVHDDMRDRSIDVRLFRLRRKLEAGGANRDIIRSERNVGYTFTMKVERQESGSSSSRDKFSLYITHRPLLDEDLEHD
jgi:two-component system, OmpR family, response regulator